MLVLSRKAGEKVLIGDVIVITVVRIGPGAVRFGIEAPGDMNIVREEIALRTTPIQGCNDDLDDIGRRLLDEAANGFVPPGCAVISDEV